MGFDPNKGGNGDTGNSGNSNVWDMGGFSYPGYGNVVYRDDLTNQNNSTDQNKDKAKITAIEDFDDDADDFVTVDLDKSVNTSGRDYGKAIRDAMTVNDVNYSSDRPIQIIDSGINVQDVSKNYNDPVFVTPAQANVIDGGDNNPGNSINIVDDSSNTEPKGSASVDVDAVKNRIQNGVDNDVNKFNPGDPNIVREYEEDTGNAEKRGLVAGIMEKVRKSGVGKLFVKATIGALLLASLAGIGANSGLLNKKATQNVTAIEQKAPGSQDGETDGSALATAEIDGLLGNQSETEKSAENLDTKVNITYADGEVLEGVNYEFGGDNTGADLLDNVNVEPGHYGPLTNKPANWVHNEGNRFREGQASKEALTALRMEVDQGINVRLGNIAPLVQDGYVYGYFGEGDNINPENMTQTGYEFSTNSEEYQSKKEMLQRDHAEREKEMSHDIILLNEGDVYSSIGAWDIKNADGTARPKFFTDSHVTTGEAGLMVRTDIDKATGLNYYEAHPEIKERVLRVMGLIEVGASEKEVQDAMAKWTVGGRLVGCMQYVCFKNTPKQKIIPPVEKTITPTPESTPNIDTKIIPPAQQVIPPAPTPENETTTTENKITTGTRHIITSTNGKHTHNTIIREDEKPRDKETPKDKEIPPEPEKETPKNKEVPPDENPKGGEKVLEAKTENVVGGNEFDSQKEVTVTDQNAAPLAGEATNNATMESSGDQLSNREVATQSVIGEFNENNASVSKEEAENKSISTSVTNENLAPNSSEAPADSFERQTVADEVVNESNGETAAQSSYDTSAAEANYDFYSAF